MYHSLYLFARNMFAPNNKKELVASPFEYKRSAARRASVLPIYENNVIQK